MDGASTDQTRLVAQDFKPKGLRLKLIVSQKRGVAYQRNAGAKLSKSPYLLFIDADSQIPPSFLIDLYNQLQRYPHDFFTVKMNSSNIHLLKKLILCAYNKMMLHTKNWSKPSVFGALMGCRRVVFNTLNGFDPLLGFGEDSELVARAIWLGFSYTIYKQPQYDYSLRRVDKEGLWLVFIGVLLGFQLLLFGQPKKALIYYPMKGGSYYD